MSGVIKGVKKIFRRVVDVVKAVWKPLLIIAATYFTAGLALSAFAPTAAFAASMPGFAGGGILGTGIGAGATAGTGVFSQAAAAMGMGSLGSAGGLAGGAMAAGTSATALGAAGFSSAAIAEGAAAVGSGALGSGAAFGAAGNAALGAGGGSGTVTVGGAAGGTAGTVGPSALTAEGFAASIAPGNLASGAAGGLGTGSGVAGAGTVGGGLSGAAAGMTLGEKMLLASSGVQALGVLMQPDPEEAKRWQGAFYGVTYKGGGAGPIPGPGQAPTPPQAQDAGPAKMSEQPSMVASNIKSPTQVEQTVQGKQKAPEPSTDLFPKPNPKVRYVNG